MFVSHPHQQQSALWAVDGCLPDNLVKGLAEESFSDGTDAVVSGLAIL